MYAEDTGGLYISDKINTFFFLYQNKMLTKLYITDHKGADKRSQFLVYIHPI